MLVRRKCGLRKPGKAYFVVEVDAFGKGLPAKFFIQDPPEPIDPSIVAAQGITVLPRAIGYDLETMQPQYALDAKGQVIYDVYDWVGGDYPNVADFVEEVLRQGVSRLTPRTSDYANIGYDSEYRLVHPRAVLCDPAPFFRERVDTGREPCPKDIELHKQPTQEWLTYYAHTCAGLWWECMAEYDVEIGGRLVERKMADGEVFTAARPPVSDPQMLPGIFMRFPIGRLGRWDVIRDEAGEYAEAAERLRLLKDGLFKRTRLMEF